MTTEEYLKKIQRGSDHIVCTKAEAQHALQEFAKHHVEQALKAAAESETYYGTESIAFNESQKDQILDSYPSENIK